MRTKIVYVLVSDCSDYYYEQTLISATSARIQNPSAKIILVVDDQTENTLIGNRRSLLDVVDEKIVVNLSAGLNNKRRSRFLKMSLREAIQGDFLYIDSDTVVCDSLVDVDSFDFEIGAVLDRHTHVDCRRDYILLDRTRKLGGHIEDGDDYYNGGVLFVKDTPETHAFFEDWKKLYERGLSVGIDYDQPPLLVCNKLHRMIHLIDGVYNCQLFLGGLPFLSNAKIIHAFNICGMSDFFLFNSKKYFDKIRKQGVVLDDDFDLIKNAKRQFNKEYKLVYGEDLDYEKSILYHLYCQNKTCFHIVEFVGKILLKICRI